MTTMLKKILVGLDGSKGSFKALGEAMFLAILAGTEVHTISVEEVPRYPGTIDEVVAEKEAADTVYASVIEKAQSMAKDTGGNAKTFCNDGTRGKNHCRIRFSKSVRPACDRFHGTFRSL